MPTSDRLVTGALTTPRMRTSCRPVLVMIWIREPTVFFGVGGAVAAAVWGLADHPGRPLRHLSAQETRQLVQRLGW